MRVPILPLPGIISDDTDFSAPGRWSDASNVRFWRGKPQTIGGWSSAIGTALTGVCRNVYGWTDNSGIDNYAFGTHSALMIWVGGVLADITPTGLAAGSIDGAGGPGYGTGPYGENDYGQSGIENEYFARTWSLASYGEWLIASPRNGTLYQWQNDTGEVAVAIDNAPAKIGSMIVTPERQILVFGCNKEVSGDFDPMAIRGCKSNDITDWTTTPYNNAFERVLEGGGRIVAGRMFGPYVAVWTDVGVHLGQYVGDGTQVYSFDPIATDCGLLGPNAVTVINQTAYWITPDFQVYGWALGGIPQPVACPILAEFRDNMVRSQSEKIVATGVGKFSEVQFFYPDMRDGVENSRYIAFSTLDGAWFRGELARTAATDAGPGDHPMFVAYDGTAYWHEFGDTADGGPIAWSITNGGLYLGDAGQRGLIRGIWPDFESQRGPINLEIICRPYPQGAETTKGPYTLATGASRRDFLADTRVAAFRFYGSSSPAFMRFGKPSVDVTITGRQ